MVAHVDYI